MQRFVVKRLHGDPILNPPKLIVFDLDFTLWDCGGTWCDCLSPPFRVRHGHISDRSGRRVSLYDDIHAILDHCDQRAVSIAVASRTEQPAWARELLEMLKVTHRFAFAEIYPTTKLRHFAALQEMSGVDYRQMLFFDDEMRNIVEVSGLGVTSVHVPDGLTLRLFHDSLREFGVQANASRRQG